MCGRWRWRSSITCCCRGAAAGAAARVVRRQPLPVLVASFALCVVPGHSRPEAAFYLLPARLGAGDRLDRGAGAAAWAAPACVGGAAVPARARGPVRGAGVAAARTRFRQHRDRLHGDPGGDRAPASRAAGSPDPERAGRGRRRLVLAVPAALADLRPALQRLRRRPVFRRALPGDPGGCDRAGAAAGLRPVPRRRAAAAPVRAALAVALVAGCAGRLAGPGAAAVHARRTDRHPRGARASRRLRLAAPRQRRLRRGL